MGSGFAKQKKLMRSMQAMLEQADQLEATGTAGNGLVTLTLSGNNELKSIRIDPACVDPTDIEGLEALIKAAYNSAFQQLQAKSPHNDLLAQFQPQ